MPIDWSAIDRSLSSSWYVSRGCTIKENEYASISSVPLAEQTVCWLGIKARYFALFPSWFSWVSQSLYISLLTSHFDCVALICWITNIFCAGSSDPADFESPHLIDRGVCCIIERWFTRAFLRPNSHTNFIVVSVLCGCIGYFSAFASRNIFGTGDWGLYPCGRESRMDRSYLLIPDFCAIFDFRLFRVSLLVDISSTLPSLNRWR